MIEIFERLGVHHDTPTLVCIPVIITLLVILVRRSGSSGNRRTD